MDYEALLKTAEKARESAYCPYSGFAVGAALLCADGTVYTGANIENAALTPTVCAERVAVFKAVSDGKREFRALAVSGGKKGRAPDRGVSPCGVCRQVLMEFCSPEDFDVVLADSGGKAAAHKLGDILPLAFGPKNLV